MRWFLEWATAGEVEDEALLPRLSSGCILACLDIPTTWRTDPHESAISMYLNHEWGKIVTKSESTTAITSCTKSHIFRQQEAQHATIRTPAWRKPTASQSPTRSSRRVAEQSKGTRKVGSSLTVNELSITKYASASPRSSKRQNP